MERNGTLTLYYKIVLLTFIWDIWDSVIGRLKGQEKIKNLPWFFTFENCPSELVQLGPGGSMQTTWSNKVCCSCAQKSIKKICVKYRASISYTEAALYSEIWITSLVLSSLISICFYIPRNKENIQRCRLENNNFPLSPGISDLNWLREKICKEIVLA